MRWLKMLGLAAFAGVAATGVVIIRDQRRRSAYTPDEVRDRLHARLGESPAPVGPARAPSRKPRFPRLPGRWPSSCARINGLIAPGRETGSGHDPLA